MNEFDTTVSGCENTRNGYDMSLEEINGLAAQLLERQPPTADDRYVCYEVDGRAAFADIGRFIERVRFEEAFGNTADEMHQEYGPYENESTFFLSLDTEKKTPVGALRIIRNSDAGLKTVNDISAPPLNLTIDVIRDSHHISTFDECWDIGTVAAMHGYPPGAASIQLYRGAYLAAMRENVQHVVSVIDMNVLPKLTNYLGFPFVSLAGTGPFEYLGSKQSQAVYGYVPEFHAQMIQKQKSTLKGRLAEKVLDRLLIGTEDRVYMTERL